MRKDHIENLRNFQTMISIKKEYVFGLRKPTKCLERDLNLCKLINFQNEDFGRKNNESQR